MTRRSYGARPEYSQLVLCLIVVETMIYIKCLRRLVASRPKFVALTADFSHDLTAEFSSLAEMSLGLTQSVLRCLPALKLRKRTLETFGFG